MEKCRMPVLLIDQVTRQGAPASPDGAKRALRRQIDQVADRLDLARLSMAEARQTAAGCRAAVSVARRRLAQAEAALSDAERQHARRAAAVDDLVNHLAALRRMAT